MHKRRAFLLGFIGSILEPVIGAMTSDDAEEIQFIRITFHH